MTISTRRAPGAPAAPAVGAGATPLDASQLAVLDLPDSRSAAVLGAPGSGKTTTVVELVHERIHGRGYRPGEVLVLAATRASATALRDRIGLRIAVPTNGPLARTVNSLAFQVVRAASAGAGTPVLLTGAEQDQIIADLLHGHVEDGAGPEWPEPLSADVRALRGFRTEIRDLLARCAELDLPPRRLAALGAGHGRAEWTAAAAFIAEYHDVKDAFRFRSFDSTELAHEAAALVREAAPGAAGSERLGPLAELRLLVVDDAQELTRSAIALLRSFAERGVTVIAVGDPDISTGSFRGARPEVIGRLAAELGLEAADRLVLDRVHRHGAAVRDVVSAVAARIGTASAGTQRRARAADAPEPAAQPSLFDLDDDPRATPGAPPAADQGRGRSGISTAIASSPAHQLEIIARRIRERHVFDGLDWSRCAVVVRSGSLVEPLSRGLAALEVPTRTTSGGTALRDEGVVRAFTTAVDVALGRRELDGATAADLLSGVLGGLDPIALRRLRAALRRQELAGGGTRGADELVVEAMTVAGALATIDTATARRATRLADSLRAAGAEAAVGATIEELLWGLWQRSGLERAWSAQARETGIAADEADRHLDAVVAMFTSAQRFVEREPHAPPALFIDELVGRDVAEDTLAPRAMASSVTVTTPAGVVGSEFDLVVVAGVQEGVWPDTRIRGTLLGSGELAAAAAGDDGTDAVDARAAVVHDELRLFAAALSRSTGEVLVTAVRDDDQAPSAFFSLLPEPDAAQHADRHPLSLRGITARLRRVMMTETDPARRAGAASELARLAEEQVPGADPDDWYGLAEASTEQPLNDQEAGDRPVRVSPSRMEAFENCELHWLIDQLGGADRSTASGLGSIIHRVAEEHGQDDDLSPARLLAEVDARWSELSFESGWQSGLERAKAAELTSRLSAYLRDFRAAGGRLLSVEGSFRLDVGSAVLSGTVDRVEVRDGEVFIVDLKTGRSEPVSDAAVVDHAQLGAYQLAWADGALGDADGAPLGGARLVVVSSGTAAQPWRQPTQAPLDAEELAAFRARVEDDARRMGGTTFVAQVGSHCVDPWSHGSCRIHVIGQVSG